jgi:zinc protease
VNLYLLGGSRQVTAATAGIEPFLLYASEYGTQHYPGEAARLALAYTGSWVTVQTTADYTRFAFRGIKQEFDSTWAVFADRLLHPTLDSAAMAITRGQLLTSIKAANDSPDGEVSRIADSLAFESHPYAIPTEGTVASIAALTADDLRKYAADQMVTSRMLLVVVGDIPRAKVEQVVTATLGTLPRGSYTWTLPPVWPAKAARVVMVQRRIPTNYILGYFSGPPQSSEDYPAFEIATGYLGGILQDVIRSEGLSYTAGAPLLERGASGGGVYVSTVRPDTVVKIINSAIDYIQAEPLPRASLIKHAKRYENRYSYQTESAVEQADVLALAQLYRGDFRAAAQFGDVLKKITGADVRRVARQYIKNIQYAYVGDTTRAPVKLMLKP